MTTIENWHDLSDIRNDLSGDYTLENDLTPHTEGYSATVGESGWDPIGDYDDDVAFGGTLDGNGHTIAGLEIYNDSFRGNGIFSYIVDGTVKNLHMEDVHLETHRSAGAIAGQTHGSDSLLTNITIEDAHIDVGTTQSAAAITGRARDGVTLSDSLVKDIYVRGTRRTAGVAGRHRDDSMMKRVGAINVMLDPTADYGNDRTGGLVGECNIGYIENCYAVGTTLISQGDGGRIGGLVGMLGDWSDAGYMYDSYAIVHAEDFDEIGSRTGVLVGYLRNGSELENCYGNDSFSLVGDEEWNADSDVESLDESSMKGTTAAQNMALDTSSGGVWETVSSGQDGASDDGPLILSDVSRSTQLRYLDLLEQGLSGQFTVDGQPVPNANVWAIRKSDNTLFGPVETDGSGEYMFPVDELKSGEEHAVAFDGEVDGQPVGGLKSIIVE